MSDAPSWVRQPLSCAMRRKMKTDLRQVQAGLKDFGEKAGRPLHDAGARQPGGRPSHQRRQGIGQGRRRLLAIHRQREPTAAGGADRAISEGAVSSPDGMAEGLLLQACA